VGYYGEHEPVGYYGEHEPYGYYAEHEPMGYYGDYAEREPYGYYGEHEPYGDYGEHEPIGDYAATPEMVGYGEHDMGGYVRDVAPAFNAGCAVPSNVAGFGEVDGYVRPQTVNPSCAQFTAQPPSGSAIPDAFKPLW
jgi:hypothetical protein